MGSALDEQWSRGQGEFSGETLGGSSFFLSHAETPCREAKAPVAFSPTWWSSRQVLVPGWEQLWETGVHSGVSLTWA